MYIIDLNNPLQLNQIAHANLQQFTSLEHMKFLHGALGFQLLSTIWHTISAGYLNSFPDLTPQNISKLAALDITILECLDAKWKNFQSTKPLILEDE